MKRGTKKRGAILLSLAMVLSLIGVGPVGSKDALAAKKIQLAKTKITVAVGKTKKIKIKNIKKKQVKKLTVKSSKNAVAKAKKAGKTSIKVTGKKAGSTKVTVQLKLKKKVGGKKAYKLTLKVTVKKAKATPEPSTEPTLPPDTGIKVNTVNLPDMTYYLGQTSLSPLDASGTSVSPADARSGGDILFQWFAGESKEKEEAVKGATTDKYTPDISKVGTSYVYYTANFVPKDKKIGATGASNTATITVLEKVPITFDANGGTFGTGTNAKTELKKEYEWGKTLGTLPSESDMTAPTSGTNGTDFLGWATTNTATYGNVYSSTKITQAATYYAVWGTRPPDTSSYTPPSAATPVITGLEYVEASGNLKCNCTVSGESNLTYQWYYTLNGEAREPITTTVNELTSNQLGDIMGSNSTIYAKVINSPSGYSASTSSPSATYAFVQFLPRNNDETITVENVQKESVVLLKQVESTLSYNEAPSISKDGGTLSGWGPYDPSSVTLDTDHTITVTQSMQLYAVWTT